jgi:RNA polymerase sigma-70 factor (ECF subfamily)
MDGRPQDGPAAGDDDRRLVEQAGEGQPAAVDELLARHLPGLRAYIRLRAGPAVRARESASDLAQSVCREVLENLHRFRYGGEVGFRHWLYATALRRIQKRHAFWHAQKRDVAREVPQPLSASAPDAAGLLACYRSFSTPSGKLMAREEIDRIEAAFDRLTEDQREVITLARLVGLGHAEIARRLGRSEGATRVLLHRALARLASLLDESAGA